jgi:hypothetical protein
MEANNGFVNKGPGVLFLEIWVLGLYCLNHQSPEWAGAEEGGFLGS